jgi:hypothetical protein
LEGGGDVFHSPLLHVGEVEECISVGTASNAVDYFSILRGHRKARSDALHLYKPASRRGHAIKETPKEVLPIS